MSCETADTNLPDMVAIFLHFDFLQKTKKNWGFLQQKAKKNISTYIPTNNTTNSKF